MTWRERDHPRDPEGRFRDRTGGGWISRVSEAIRGRGDGHGMVQGRDLLEEGGLDFTAMVAGRRGREHDEMLDSIYEAQGYHGRPAVVSADEMDALTAGGWLQLWRGVVGDTAHDSGYYAEDYRSGERHYPGGGIKGNGTYSSTDRAHALDYTDFDYGRYTDDFESDPERFSGISNAREHPRYRPGLLRLALHPDARVVNYGDISDEYEQYQAHSYDRSAAVAARAQLEVATIQAADLSESEHMTQSRAAMQRMLDAQETLRHEREAMRDLGRFAAARGYDAIRVHPDGKHSFYVILNRSATAVQEAYRDQS